MATVPTAGWSDDNEAAAHASGHESWSAWVSKVEEERGYEVCGARNRSQIPCSGRPGDGAGGRCHSHGGASLSGPAAGSWRNGSTSEVIPEKFRRGLAEWLEFTDRLSLDPQLGILWHREIEVLTAIDGGHDPATALSAIGGTFSDLESAMAAGDAKGTMDRIREIRKILDSSMGVTQAWSEWLRLVEMRRKLVKEQREMEKASDDSLSRDRVVALVVWQVDTFNRALDAHVKSIKERRLVMQDVATENRKMVAFRAAAM